MANDANTKYTSRAAQMYREKIRQLGSAALTRHGTDLWMDSMNSVPSHSPGKKDSDFFTEHTQVSTTGMFPLINALLTKAVYTLL